MLKSFEKCDLDILTETDDFDLRTKEKVKKNTCEIRKLFHLSLKDYANVKGVFFI